jgi:hypothetical protein
MAGEIINLRSARKAKLRSEKEDRASANRARHGRTKSEKELEEARRNKAARDLAAHRREDGGSQG